MSLGCLVVTLRDAEEARWGAVAAPALVTITAWAVEVMEAILVRAAAFAADYQVFVSSASFDDVPQA